MDVIIFDIEVLEYDWLFGYRKYGSTEYKYIHNDIPAMQQFYKENKTNIWVGYNNEYYDNPVLESIIKEEDFFAKSCNIVEEHQHYYSTMFLSYDLFKQPIRQVIRGLSLKTLALYFGYSGYESPIDFKIKRPLSKYELKDFIYYNKTDVDLTYECFEYHLHNNFAAKVQFCKTFNIPVNFINRTWGTLAAKVVTFDPKVKLFEDDVYFKVPETLELGKQFQYVLDSIPATGNLPKTPVVKYVVGGLEHKLGEGGAHAAIPKSKHLNVHFYDVGSFYPNMHKYYNYMQSRTISDKSFTGNAVDIRMSYKEAGDSRQESYKILLVTTYGITKLKGSKFYDPASQYLTAVSGQLFLLDLNNKLEAELGNDFKLIQSNTDGIGIQVPDTEDPRLVKVIEEWERRTGFTLELTSYDVLYQKDVNNYLALVKDDDYHNGILTSKNLKVKGRFLNKYFPLDFKKQPLFDDVNNRWMSLGLVRLLVFDELDISDLNAKDLQIICTKGSAREMCMNGKPVPKSVRVYPVLPHVKNQGQLTRTYNMRGKLTIKKEGPNNMMLYMDQVLKVPDSFYRDIDYDYYYNAIVDKAIDFGYNGIHAFDYIDMQLKQVNTPTLQKKLIKRLGFTHMCDYIEERDKVMIYD